MILFTSVIDEHDPAPKNEPRFQFSVPRLTNASFVDSENVAVPESIFQRRNMISGGIVLHILLIANIAQTAEASGIVDASLITTAILLQTLVDICTKSNTSSATENDRRNDFGGESRTDAILSRASHKFEAQARRHDVILNDDPDVSSFQGLRQVHDGQSADGDVARPEQNRLQSRTERFKN